MNVKLYKASTNGEFKQKLKQESNNFSTKLAIVFASVQYDFKEALQELKENNINFIGCSSCGEISSVVSNKTVTERSAVTALLDIDETKFHTNFFDGDAKTSFELGTNIGNWGKSVFTSPAFIVLVSGLQTDGEQVVNGIINICGEKAQIFGGLAGDDALFNETFVFCNDNISNNGAVVLALDTDKIDIHGIATSGWIELGAEKTVTKSEGNILYTIDNAPALEVYKNYLNVKDDDLPGIGVEYPLLVFRQDGTSVLRAILNVDKEKKTMTFAGTIPQGAKIKFSSSPGFEVVDFVKNDLRSFYKDYNNSDLLLLFSCMARHMAIGPMVEDEISESLNLWKSPLIGFFTYGEIGVNAKGKCDFYNETYTLVTLKDKK